MTRVGCYPGSFNPLTVAHLAVAEAARDAAALDRVDLVISRDALGKDDVADEELEQRLAQLRSAAAAHDWLGVALTEHRLVVDIAQGYEVVIMGADKWRQVNDPDWYADVAARDDAVARLPRALVAPRGDDEPDDVELLDLDPAHRAVSSSAVRSGHPHAAGWSV